MMRRISALFRDPVSGLMHLASALAAAVGLLVLMAAGRGVPAHQASLLLYGTSLVLLFSASAAYHLTAAGSAAVPVLRRLDHAAIFLLIAGTYTPICVTVLSRPIGTAVLAVVWSIAGAGILLKAVFFDKVRSRVSTMLYIVMGWAALVVVVPLVRALPLGGLLWLLAGGLCYTGGALIYARKRLNVAPGFGFHEIWHIFVSAGAAAHYILILRYVAGR